MKKISNIFIVLAVILSDVMCAVVGYNYATMQWGSKLNLCHFVRCLKPAISPYK